MPRPGGASTTPALALSAPPTRAPTLAAPPSAHRRWRGDGGRGVLPVAFFFFFFLALVSAVSHMRDMYTHTHTRTHAHTTRATHAHTHSFSLPLSFLSRGPFSPSLFSPLTPFLPHHRPCSTTCDISNCSLFHAADGFGGFCTFLVVRPILLCTSPPARRPAGSPIHLLSPPPQICLIIMASVYNCGQITRELGIALVAVHGGE